MNPVRVLIVDDSSVARRLLESVIKEEKGMEIVGEAKNGEIALAILRETPVDVVILDIEMPVMDGLETLKNIRKRDKHLPVIMFSSLTHRGAEATLKALYLGASDYFHKPFQEQDVDATIEVIRTQLVPRIREISQQGRTRSFGKIVAPKNLPGQSLGALTPRAGQRVEIVVIGLSTGGPQALNTFFDAMPKPLSVPVLIVQHMPAMFTKLLAERLDDATQFTVREATHGVRPKGGEIWIAPGEHHMEVDHDKLGMVLCLNQKPPENFCRPSVDVLFRSAAKAFGSNVLAVVMTGMGRDGQNGAKEIAARRGKILVQDEASSVVWSMPRAIIEAGLAEDALPPAGLAIEVFRRVMDGRK